MANNTGGSNQMGSIWKSGATAEKLVKVRKKGRNSPSQKRRNARHLERGLERKSSNNSSNRDHPHEARVKNSQGTSEPILQCY